MPALPYWLFPGDDRPTEEIDDEIAEELQLHLDLLAEEQERRGLAPEEAKQKAAERFGDFNQLLRRCRREKQGDAPMLLRVQTALLVLLIALVAAAGWRMTYIPDPILNAQYMSQTTELLQTIQNELADMRSGVKSADSASPQGEDTLSIQVIDDDGKAIKNASLTFGWTDATRSYLDSYVVTTNSDGMHDTRLTFRDKQLDSVTAYAPGYAFVSESLNRPFEPGATLTLTLPKATKQRLLILAPSKTENLPGRPLADAEVRVTSRTSANGRSSNSQWLQLKLRTDDEGVVEIDCAAPGDEIQLTAWEPKMTWVAGPIAIKAKLDEKTSELLTVELRPMSTPRNFGGGGGMF
jgi:hypothetical protein